MDIHSPGWMILTLLKIGTTPPADIDGDCTRRTSPIDGPAPWAKFRPASCAAMASLTAFRSGGLLELASSLARLTLPISSGIIP